MNQQTQQQQQQHQQQPRSDHHDQNNNNNTSTITTGSGSGSGPSSDHHHQIPTNHTSNQIEPRTINLSTTSTEQSKLKLYIQHDQLHQSQLNHFKQHRRQEINELYQELVQHQKQDWLAYRPQHQHPNRTKLRLSIEDDRERSMGKRKTRALIRLSKDQIRSIDQIDDTLVPIRLEIEFEHWKLRDTFLWNLNEPAITPEQFASHLCEDLILPIQHFLPLISNSIKEQLDDYKVHQHFIAHRSTTLNHTDLDWPSSKTRREKSKRIKLDEDQEEDDQHETQNRKNDHSHHQNHDDDFDIVHHPQLIRPDEEGDEELRIIINLDIISGPIHLQDRFEWDISDPNNHPEQFTEVYVNDLGLSGEFKTAVAHSIREQIETYVKSLALVEHVHAQPVPNDELRYAFLGPISDPVRTALVADDHTPFLSLLTADELDRQEKEHDRESRRKRRQTRSRRGITLPDRDPQRTVRTIVPRQGVKMVQAFLDENEDTVLPVQPIVEPFPIKESHVSLPEPTTDHQPKRILNPAAKEQQHLQVEPLPTGPTTHTPIKSNSSGHRSSRRLRGATADVVTVETPPPTPNEEKKDEPHDHPTPSSSNLSKKVTNHQSSSLTATQNPVTTRTSRGVNWEALGLHDPIINGIWHCSNCGCPEQVAVGRRKGPGGKDTLCGECGRYIHRFKKNRPTLYNTSADYHTSLKLEADKAIQAIADQEQLRKEKHKNEMIPTSSSQNKKRKKEQPTGPATGGGNGLGRPRREVKSLSGSRESSPVVTMRSNNRDDKRKKARLEPSGTKRIRQLVNNKGGKDLDDDDDGERGSIGGSRSSSQIPTRLMNNEEGEENGGGSSSSSSKKERKGMDDVKREVVEESKEEVEEMNVSKVVDEGVKSKEDEGRVVGESSSSRSSSRSTRLSRNGQMREKPVEEMVDHHEEQKNGNGNGGDEEDQNRSSNSDSKVQKEIGEDLNNPKMNKNKSTSIHPTSNSKLGVGGIRRPGPTDWMIECLKELRKTYVNDRVELVPKMRKDPGGGGGGSSSGQVPGWRLKCLDCPGKLYTVGPNESFDNFVVHLKNRTHRAKVDERIQASSSSTNHHQELPTDPPIPPRPNPSLPPPPPPPTFPVPPTHSTLLTPPPPHRPPPPPTYRHFPTTSTIPTPPSTLVHPLPKKPML